MFVVYRHLRKDTMQPFYVGKGSLVRAFRSSSRNKYWTHIADRGYVVQIVRTFNSETAALEFERQLIALYRKFGFCEANFADGGQGTSGYRHTEAAKEKCRRANLGKKLSEEAKVKLRGKRAGRQPFLGKHKSEDSKRRNALSAARFEYTTPNGKFLLPKDAAKEFGVSSKTITRWCQGNKPGFSLVKLSQEVSYE